MAVFPLIVVELISIRFAVDYRIKTFESFEFICCTARTKFAERPGIGFTATFKCLNTIIECKKPNSTTINGNIAKKLSKRQLTVMASKEELSKQKIAIVSRDYEIYERLFAEKPSEFSRLVFSSNTPSDIVFNEAEIILSEPDLAATFIHKCKCLKWLQSTWAGNNKLQDCNLRNYLLTGVKGIFYDQMKEYVFAFILSHYRQLNTLKQYQEKRQWKSISGKRVRGLTFGVLGFGSIAKQLIEPAKAFGINVIGLTTNGGVIGNTQCYSNKDKLLFAGNCDVVLNLLPDTESTKGFCDQAFFNHMKRNGLFINAGRGSVVDGPATLINALNNNQISAAILDVFEHEPLPSNHPYYDHPKITITNHSAAISNPQDVFSVFLDNYQRYKNEQALLYVHDFEKGY